MIYWRPFDYKGLDDLEQDITDQKLHLPISKDIDVLCEPIEVLGKRVKNRIAIQPLECFDSSTEGTPGDLTFRRYRRLSAGGAGMIWFESCSPTPKSQTSRWQCRITEKNLNVFRQLVREIKECAYEGVPPFLIVQVTNCGRNSRLDGDGKFGKDGLPQYIATPNPYIPKPNAVIMSDGDLDNAIDEYVQNAMLMKEAGFDAIDIRACHGYLISELLASFTRKDSRYGGSFENRTRFLLNVIDRINEEVKIPLGIRYNACDMVPYPYGWGMKKDGTLISDYTEPFKLAELLIQRGVTLLNVSMGCNHATHLQLPYNHYSFYPEDHQLTALAFYHGLSETFKKEFPDTVVMTGTLSWARHFSPNVAAGGIEAGMYDMAGFGRMAMAYPDFAKDIIENGELDEKKCCIACNTCLNMIGAAASTGCPVGCPIRDKEVYGPIYKEYVGKTKRSMLPQSVQLFNLQEKAPH